MGYLVQKFIVEDAAKASPLLPQHVALVNPDGSAWEGSGGGGYVLPAATTMALGGVKQAASVAAVASADSTVPSQANAGSIAAADAAAAASETITKAEFDAAVTLANECKAKHNAAVSLVNELKTVCTALAAECNETKRQLNALLSAMGTAGQMAGASKAKRR